MCQRAGCRDIGRNTGCGPRVKSPHMCEAWLGTFPHRLGPPQSATRSQARDHGENDPSMASFHAAARHYLSAKWQIFSHIITSHTLDRSVVETHYSSCSIRCTSWPRRDFSATRSPTFSPSRPASFRGREAFSCRRSSRTVHARHMYVDWNGGSASKCTQVVPQPHYIGEKVVKKVVPRILPPVTKPIENIV